jgi:SsrA-binding protein
MQDSLIAKNKKAGFEYHIHEHIEVGLVLQGWEVKGLRLGKGQLTDAHAIIRKGEIWLLNARIQPPTFAVSYLLYEETRTRKLLLNRRQIDRLEGLVNRQGYTLIPLKLYWKDGGRIVKCELAVASGKKTADKRATIKEREWQREKQRTLKNDHR